MQESRDPAARRVALLGQGLLTAGLFVLVLGLLRANDDRWSSTRTVAELAGATAVLAGFVIVEWRSREPMLPLALFRTPAFTAAQLSAFAISASFFARYLYATLYLQDVLGLSAVLPGHPGLHRPLPEPFRRRLYLSEYKVTLVSAAARQAGAAGRRARVADTAAIEVPRAAPLEDIELLGAGGPPRSY